MLDFLRAKALSSNPLSLLIASMCSISQLHFLPFLSSMYNGQDVSSYREAYKVEMLIRDVEEERRLTSFSRVVVSSIHIEMQADCRN